MNTNDCYYFLNKKETKDSYAFLPPLDIYSIRRDFPVLNRYVNGKPLIWLDNSATTQKPIQVIDAINHYYSKFNSNIHRGAHTLAKEATDAYEAARDKIRTFIGAKSSKEIIFVRGTTEGINLVAKTYGAANLKKGDEIILSLMEHHSNIVPWQNLAKLKGAKIRVIPVNQDGEIILDEYKKILNNRTKIVAITQLSNVLGTINPVREIIDLAHDAGAKVLVDGAQSIPHIPLNVGELNADFFVFSGHKIYGPTGIGVLYGKEELLEEMPPYERGGGMINDVSFEKTVYNDLPYKFEAGTGNIADAIGLSYAVEYIKNIGIQSIAKYESDLTIYAMERLASIKGIRLIGTAKNKSSVLSYVFNNTNPEEAAKHMNKEGIAVRAGHHCAQPILRYFDVDSALRASIGIYNTKEEIDKLIQITERITKI